MPIRDAKGTVAHVLEIGEDITEQKENEEVIRRMAYFDPLTSLPNRARFNERARAARASATTARSWCSSSTSTVSRT